MPNKKQPAEPSEIPGKMHPEINPPVDPEEPLVPPEDDPDIIPDEEIESPPYDEPAPPGEGP
jgi:hypothetical protein